MSRLVRMRQTLARVLSRPASRGSERGVALLMVLMLITLLGSVVADFQFNSRVDLQLAINARDELQAEYNAMSALRLRAMLLKQAGRIKGFLTGLMQLAGVDAGGAPPIGRMLEMIPIECGLMSSITRQAGISLEDNAEQTEFFPGECLATSKSEHSKIPINAFRNPGKAKQALILLGGFLSDQRLERHFQEDDRNGTHAETPEELVAAVADWVDADKAQTFNQVGDEDRHYSSLRDSYRAKNAPFDSLAELQLVHGIDDELYAILKDHVSIYNTEPQIEVGTAPELRIFLGMAAALREGVFADQLFLHPGFMEMRLMMREMNEMSMGMMPLNLALLRNMVNESGLSNVVDARQLNSFFTDKSNTTWYTIEAQGRVGNATRRIRAVFQSSEAKFYYFRIE